MKGKLLLKGDVDRSLFEYGQQIRKAFERLPERTVDQMRSAPDRNHALATLSEEIGKVLVDLTNITNDALTKISESSTLRKKVI